MRVIPLFCPDEQFGKYKNQYAEWFNSYQQNIRTHNSSVTSCIKRKQQLLLPNVFNISTDIKSRVKFLQSYLCHTK